MSNVREVVATKPSFVVAHRGNSRFAPENTLPAFQSALDLGTPFVELDYVHSSDGIPIVFHDETLDRTTDAIARWGRKRVSPDQCDLLRLQTLDAGAWFGPEFVGVKIPSLTEALERILARGFCMIERKHGSAATIASILRSRPEWIPRVIVMSFDWEFLGAVRASIPEVAIGALGEGSPTQEELAPVQPIGACVLGWRQEDIDGPFVDLATSLGLRVWGWTVDSPERAKELLSLGVQGIISNDPGTMLRIVAGT